jgi:hypothetical protein|tara:strand:- start:6982 stop:7287 length:306 start_codon:yes stop_codon:yes gene_type:complete
MKNQIKRIESQLRWTMYAHIAVTMLKAMPTRKIISKNFDDIRAMQRHELMNYIHNNRKPCDRIKSKKYSPQDAYIASKVVYAQNRLVLTDESRQSHNYHHC